LFSVIGLPQTDDAAVRATRCPDQYDHAQVEVADGDETWLAIICPIIPEGQDVAIKHLTDPRHVQAAGGQRGLALDRIEADRHGIVLLQKTFAQKLLL
jgi:hypothetical protein